MMRKIKDLHEKMCKNVESIVLCVHGVKQERGIFFNEKGNHVYNKCYYY